MKKIKISRPGYQIPLEKLLNVYRKELRSDKLNSKPSKENLIIEKNKIFFKSYWSMLIAKDSFCLYC